MKFTQPPFILAHQGDSQGCGWHRVARPLQILSRGGYIAGRSEFSFLQDNILSAIAPDIIIFQRQTDPAQLLHVERYRRILPAAIFIFENDDALGAVPEASWHQPYIAPGMDAKLSNAMQHFDIITTTTQELADYHRSLLPSGCNIPVRVTPNMLGVDDLAGAAKIRADSPIKPGTKLRIGWGGGISHTGDLAILHEAMSALRDRVEWIFLGMDPEVPEGTLKFHAGITTPDRFLVSLAALNVDLIVAPLEDNFFNRCKSNLRLLEAGACSYPVIASPVSPYLTDDPPVYGYAENPSQWISQIENFISLSPEHRARYGEKMNHWVKSRYILDDAKNSEKRLRDWLPIHTRIFIPNLHRTGTGRATICSTADALTEAFQSTDDDVLYVREGTILPPKAPDRLQAISGDVTCPMSNDGGPWGFPATAGFTPLDGLAISQLDELCRDIGMAPIEASAVSGPVVLIRRKVIAALGCPDFHSTIPLEITLLEYSVAAKARGLLVTINPRVFVGAQQPIITQQIDAESAALRIGGRWPQSQTDEIHLKELRQTLELSFHRDNYHQLPLQNRADYSTWAELCDTRGAISIEAAKSYCTQLPDYTLPAFVPYPMNFTKPIDPVEWFLFFPSSGKIVADGVQLAMKAISEAPANAKLIYFDHDYIAPTGQRGTPDFKPHVIDLHMLLSRDYISQAVLIHSSELPDGFEADTASVYDIALQIIQRHGRSSAWHCGHILVHTQPMRVEEEMKYSARKLQSAAGFLDWSKWPATITGHPIPSLRTLHYSPGVDHGELPQVTIIIPTRDNLDMIAPCVNTILKMTTYSNYHVVIVDHCNGEPSVVAWLEKISTDYRVSVVKYTNPEFNWSTINNWAFDHYAGASDYVCFLNDDTRVMSPGWLHEMVGAAQTPDAGAIGARLIFPHGQIQHIGVAVSRGVAGHIHKGQPLNYPGYNGIAAVSHENSAVTGACMVVESKLFAATRFDEEFNQNFNDVAFCLTLQQQGKINILANGAELQHLEGVTRNPGNTSTGLSQQAMERIQREGELLLKKFPHDDIYWNPNLEFMYVQNGQAIAGMNFDCHKYPPPEIPWAKSSKEHILLYGPESSVMDEIRDGAAIYKLEVNFNTVRIAHPPMGNSGPWDIRDPRQAAAALKHLKLDRVVLSALGDAPVQLLQFLRRLNVPVSYRPVNAESACPRGDLRPDNKVNTFCNRGYATGECSACIDQHSSPHGHVDPELWKLTWAAFFADTEGLAPVDVSPLFLQEAPFMEALLVLFSPQPLSEAAE